MDENTIGEIANQFLIQGNKELARKIGTVCEIMELAPGDVLTQEGESENDLYMILQGKFSVFFQGAQIAFRESGIHVGEMSVVDPGSERSATIAAQTPAKVAKISHFQFAELADAHPILWRGIAVELARRIRSLNEYISGQEPEPEMPILEEIPEE